MTVPVELNELLEQLAENAHEVWARLRMSEGWTYGPNRDDDAKQHPDLRPYDELDDGEREYDRAMARGTIELVLAFGFTIQRPESQ